MSHLKLRHQQHHRDHQPVARLHFMRGFFILIIIVGMIVIFVGTIIIIVGRIIIIIVGMIIIIIFIFITTPYSGQDSTA